ncbi:MAG: hypothetical protein WA906_12325 [Pacificimonas sp.]
MTDTDLNELRRIAEAGRDRPLLGGRDFLIWGTILPLAGLYHGALAAGLFAAPPWSLAISWFGAAMLALAITKSGGKRDRTPLASAQRVERQVWQAAGATFGVLAIGLFTHGLVGGFDTVTSAGFAMLAPISFSIYGIAISASAAAAGADWMKRYAILAFVFAGVTVTIIANPWLYFVYALGIFLVSVPLGRGLVAREDG